MPQTPSELRGDKVEKPIDPNPAGQDPDKLLPGSSSLAVLLVVFATVSFLVLFSIVRGGVGHVTESEGGSRAFGPTEVTGVDFDIELLPGTEEAISGPDDGGFLVPPRRGPRAAISRVRNAIPRWRSTLNTGCSRRCTTTSSLSTAHPIAGVSTATTPTTAMY